MSSKYLIANHHSKLLLLSATTSNISINKVMKRATRSHRIMHCFWRRQQHNTWKPIKYVVFTSFANLQINLKAREETSSTDNHFLPSLPLAGHIHWENLKKQQNVSDHTHSKRFRMKNCFVESQFILQVQIKCMWYTRCWECQTTSWMHAGWLSPRREPTKTKHIRNNSSVCCLCVCLCARGEGACVLSELHSWMASSSYTINLSLIRETKWKGLPAIKHL